MNDTTVYIRNVVFPLDEIFFIQISVEIKLLQVDIQLTIANFFCRHPT